ncbi:hypothetical protein RJ640_030483 [Escallonia rubra]|uniref:Protein kinase domain-containing protein n=1 Tax=Escallonia rubra TaxID=112253 RepID=A0AA88QE88_9ASTE|nr:hypothetical protein RJ640_030483 [Escallonia rubra]
MHAPTRLLHPLFLTLYLLAVAATTQQLPPPPLTSLQPTDAAALLSFRSKADTDNKLIYTLNEHFDYCNWQGVKCVQGRVVRYVLQGYGLKGTFAPDTLTRLDQLRVLSLKNNSLVGPIPELAQLVNLKTLFLDHNSFSGAFPLSLLPLHRLRSLDLSHNNISGSLPAGLTGLDRLNYLRLDFNRFNGTLPPFNQSSLTVFNVSGNNLSGPVPVTPTLTRFGISSFALNPNLCGEIVNKVCHSPFFDSPPSAAASPPSPLLQNADSQGLLLSPPASKKHKRVGLILGFVIGTLLLIAAILCLFTLVKRRRDEAQSNSTMSNSVALNANLTESTAAMPIVSTVSADQEVKEKKMQVVNVVVPQKREKSGNLVFCVGESPFCTLEQLMRASAELLGRGTIGTTYKASMDNQLTVTVKRLDAGKTAITSAEEFEQHLAAVGALRHPNLVPVRAYFQAKQERLIIYDFQPNGSLFNLIHGSRSTRAKPLHWTSCLKIAEDVALGLAYIHQASRLIHGNLKSSNILLGADFEACLTDYCLAILADSTSNDNPNSAGYKAPEIRKSSRRTTSKSDVYAFGILLLELLTGKPPSQHPFLVAADMPDWVRAMRDDDGGDDNRLGMLVHLASICSLTSPEQRPAMWQVLKMIQEIKESAMAEDNTRDAFIVYS